MNLFDGRKYESSRTIADISGIQHGTTLAKIRVINDYLRKTGRCPSDYWLRTTYKDSKCENRTEYQMTLTGVELYIQRSKRSTGIVELLTKIEGSSDFNTVSHTEEEFRRPLVEILDELGIKMKCDVIMDNEYILGYYIKDHKIAFEFDYDQVKDDEIDKYIKKELKCTFLRLNASDKPMINVGKVLKHIMK